jgi:hypothetical protein
MWSGSVKHDVPDQTINMIFPTVPGIVATRRAIPIYLSHMTQALIEVNVRLLPVPFFCCTRDYEDNLVVRVFVMLALDPLVSEST